MQHINSSSSTGLSLGNSFMLEQGTAQNSYSKKFILLIWLSDIGSPQDDVDADGRFTAMVTYKTPVGGGLTATVEGMEDSSSGSSVIGG